MIDYNIHTEQEPNVGTENDDYPETWARADDLVVAVIFVASIVACFLGVI